MIRHQIFGAAHLDRIGVFDGSPGFGQSNPGQMREAPGGAAFNVASSLAALGGNVSLSSIVADDSSGNRIRSAVKARGVSFTQLAGGDPHSTATYTAILDAQGELVIALADMEIYAGVRVDNEETAPTEWVLIDANFPESVIDAILRKPAAHRAAMTVSAAKAHRLRSVLHHLDVLFTNRAEAAALCQSPEETPLADLSEQLTAIGCRRAVISDGAAPICLLDNGVSAEISIPPCDIVDVTGAGDALAAGTLFALANGAAFKDAVDAGSLAAQAILADAGPYRSDLATIIGAPE